MVGHHASADGKDNDDDEPYEEEEQVQEEKDGDLNEEWDRPDIRPIL